MGYFLGVLVFAAAIVGFVWWKRRQAGRQDHQILSFVALLKEPQLLEPIYLQTAARKAWNADLGTGDDEGDDGFVAGSPGMPSLVMQYRERMLLVNNFPMPYVEDPEGASASIADLRLRELFGQHTSWLSCDAMGVESFDDADEVREWYRILGRLLCELVDDNCLAIFLPLTNQLFANMDETIDKLKSDDPLAELMEDAPVPVIQIDDDDPRMIAAVQQARDSFPEFVSAFEERAGENFSVKAPVTAGDNTEFIWISVEAVENDVIYGRLANEPIDLGSLKIDSQVRVAAEDLNDWAFIDQEEEPHGLFTMAALAEAEAERQEGIDE